MIRNAVEYAGLAAFAELGIVLFGFAFLLIVIRLFFIPKEKAESLANLPFVDEESP